MPATLSADAALPSTRAPSPLAEGKGYRSLHGDFNYYPTSVHKRRQQREASGGEGIVTTNRVAEVSLSPSTRLVRRADTSPSPSGLSRSPSQGTLDIGLLGRHSSSQPLAPTPHEDNVALKPASASLCFAKGGAPLLHRYRTSCADVSPRALYRRTSFPSKVSTSIPVAADGTTKRPNNIRRSILNTRSVAPSEPCTVLTSLKDDSATQEAMLQESGATPLQAQLPPSSTTFRKRVDNLDGKVPLTSIRLVDAAPASPSSLKKSAAAPATPAAASGHTRGTSNVKSVHVEDEICGKGERQDIGTASLSAQTNPDSLLSRGVTTARHCNDRACMHSEQSICEFVHMQRELRRCYATMENYEVVVAQLRDDCALARAQLCRYRQEYAQPKKEMEAQVQAEATEQTNGLSLALQRLEANDASHENISAGPVQDAKDAAEEYLRGTWKTTVDELSRALREEQSAHAESLARLKEALASKARWKSRAVELFKWREQVCREVYASSAPLSSSLAAGTGAIRTSGAPPGVSPIRNCASDSQAKPSTGHSASNASSPFQPLHHSPSPHKLLQCVSFLSEARKLRSSMASEVSTASAAPPDEGGPGDHVAHESEKDSNSTPGVDMSCQSDSTTGSILSASPSLAGRITKALGSGVVVVWPPLTEEQGRGTGKSAELSRTQSSTTADAMEARPSVLCDDAGEQGLQPSHPINPISSSALPSSAGCCTMSTVESNVQEGCRASATGAEKAMVAAAPLRAIPDLFAFPSPPAYGDVGCAIHRSLSRSNPLPTSCDVSATMAPVSAERKCKELLRALLDKEHQLSLIAEERTKYKRLYEATRS
ncbi:hypothetical protein Q4I28_001801 [Leishmania naiffi]|uniref:Flagellum transition zone component n=1 Tax=Leishmania naiffi TaxID=5678 RepID=A0AAW3C2Y9_9TRYP